MKKKIITSRPGKYYKGQYMSFLYISHQQAQNTQTSLCIFKDSPEPMLLTYMNYGCRWRLRPKYSLQALLDTSAWVFNRGIRTYVISIKFSYALDFQQCGILTSVDWDGPVQADFKLRNSKWCSFSSLTLIEYSSNLKGVRHPKNMSRYMRLPTMWYVLSAKAQISLLLRTVWSEPLLVDWIFCDCKATDWTQFAVSKLNRRRQRLVWVYTCQNFTLLEITCCDSIMLKLVDKKIFTILQ